MSHRFVLNAQRQIWGGLFDAVAGATLVIAPDRPPTSAEMSELTVATAFETPDAVVTELAGLVMRIGIAIEAGCRDEVVAAIEAGKPRRPDLVWATVGRMVQIVRRLRPLDEATLYLLAPVIRSIGEHPLIINLPN